MKVKVPEEALYAPSVNIRVYDNRPFFLGGKCLVGTASLNAGDFLAWNESLPSRASMTAASIDVGQVGVQDPNTASDDGIGVFSNDEDWSVQIER